MQKKDKMDKRVVAISLIAIMAMATVLAYRSIEKISSIDFGNFDLEDDDDQEFDL